MTWLRSSLLLSCCVLALSQTACNTPARRQLKMSQHRAMRLLHMSHKLQAQAAQLLDDSTHDIMLEESEA